MATETDNIIFNEKWPVPVDTVRRLVNSLREAIRAAGAEADDATFVATLPGLIPKGGGDAHTLTIELSGRAWKNTYLPEFNKAIARAVLGRAGLVQPVGRVQHILRDAAGEMVEVREVYEF